MEYNFDVLARSPLFEGILPADATAMLGCLSAKSAHYPKGAFILHSGDPVHVIGLVCSGCVCVLQEDFWGNRNILGKAGPGELFAEAYACSPDSTLGVSVVAEADARILFLDVGRVLTTCSAACAFHARLIRNLLSVVAAKNLRMTEKLTHMARRTTREKLLSYLSAEAIRQNTRTLCIPFNRQQLADYLAVDRSALSTALGKMRDDGLLTFHKDQFVLHTTADGA